MVVSIYLLTALKQTISIMCQNRDYKSIESLELSLDRVNSWISNCDQKAGLLLATIGIVLAILFATDFVDVVKSSIIEPFMLCLKEPEHYEFSSSRFFFSISLLLSVLTCVISSVYALRTISAELNAKEISKVNPSLLSDSYLFFQTISSKSYEDFSEFEGVEYQKDLLSQIYINSSICSKKFGFYKVALRYFYGVVLNIAVMYILYLFI